MALVEEVSGEEEGVTPSGIKPRGLVQRCFREEVRTTNRGPDHGLH